MEKEKLVERKIFIGSTMPPALAKIFGMHVLICDLLVVANL